MTTETATVNETETVTEQPLPWVFEIREEKFAQLVERLEKMVGRARKCKLPPPSFEVIWEADEKKVRSHIDSEGKRVETEYWVRYFYVVVEGQKPTLGGWDFVATIDHTEADADGVGNIIKAVPGAGEMPTAYRKSLPVCQHCGHARRRNETFIIRKSDDPSVTKQIGRNCLADFFPGLDPAEVAQQLSWWTDATEMLGECGGEDDDFGGGRRGEERFGLESLLQTTQAAIEAYGWVSRAKARESYDLEPTADLVALCYTPERYLCEAEKAVVKKVREHADAEKHAPMVEAALEWIRGIDPEAAEDYLYNLHVICKGETVRRDRLGLACSLLPAHRRFLQGERERVEHERNPSEYVGEVGTRSLFQGCELKFMSEPYQSDWGTTTRLMFLQGSNVIIWWASKPGDFEVGETYDLVCTPKKHEEYHNDRKGITTKQTVVSRVAVATEKDIKKYTKKRKATA